MSTSSGGDAGNRLEQADRHAPVGEDLDLAARTALRGRLLAEQVADGTNGAPQSRNPALGRGLGYLLAVCRLRLSRISCARFSARSLKEAGADGVGDFTRGVRFVKGSAEAFMEVILLHFWQVFKVDNGLLTLAPAVVDEGDVNARVVSIPLDKLPNGDTCTDVGIHMLRERHRSTRSVLALQTAGTRQRAAPQRFHGIAVGVDDLDVAASRKRGFDLRGCRLDPVAVRVVHDFGAPHRRAGEGVALASTPRVNEPTRQKQRGCAFA